MRYYLTIIIIAIIAIILIFIPINNKELKTKNITLLRIGLAPDESEAITLKKYKKIFDYLKEETGLNYQIIFPNSYSQLVNLFEKQKIDFAYFGGASFLKAHQKNNAIPLVMRDIDLNFKTHFIVNSSSNYKNIEDLKGKIIAFSDKLSTSGHLMPRYFLEEKGIIPEKFFKKVIYSGKHDKTAEYIINGKADIGAINSNILDNLYKDKIITKEQIKVIKTTNSYPNYVWAIQPYVEKDLRDIIADTFLSLRTNNPNNKYILDKIGTSHFISASIEDFDKLKKILTKIEVIDNENK